MHTDIGRGSHVLRINGLLAACWLLLSCRGDTEQDPTSVGSEEGNSAASEGQAEGAALQRDVRLFEYEFKPPSEIMGAFLMANNLGKLLVENDCLLILHERGERLVPVFQRGTASFDAAARTLYTSGTAIPVGSEVAFGGSSAGDIFQAFPPRSMLRECGADFFWSIPDGGRGLGLASDVPQVDLTTQ